MKQETADLTAALLEHMSELDVINQKLIPALDVVGEKYEKQQIFLPQLINAANAAYAGFNCVCGARHMLELVQTLDCSGLTLALMPNAGYPEVRGSRTFYHGDPAYFADQLVEMVRCGAAILGGCCGTTPAHIAAVAMEAIRKQ